MSNLDDLPFVSVIIPLFNEEAYVGLTLKALQEVNYPRDLYEVIVVDNGSTDRSREIASSFDVNLIEEPDLKVGGVRNAGANVAKGDIFAFLDSDCLIQKEWISASVERLKTAEVGAVGGNGMLRPDPTWVETAWVIDNFPIKSRVNSLGGGSFILTKQLFLQCGGFDPSLNAGEDTKLSKAITERGYQLEFVPSCAIIHLGFPTTVKAFCQRQYWQSSSYGKAKFNLIDKVFLLTVFTLFCLIACITLFALSSPFSLYLLLPLLFNSTLLTTNRIFKARSRSIKLVFLLQIALLDLLYLYSRVSGLAVSLFFDPFNKKAV